jgi:glutamate--cysteine ligase
VTALTALTEESAEAYLDTHCFETGPTGFVAAVVDLLPVALLPVDPPTGPVFQRLRHGHLSGEYDAVISVSSPPSPGLDASIRRTAQDLALARALLARHGLAAGERALDAYRMTVDPRRDAGAAVRVCLDAGSDGPDLGRRWAVAHAVGPVLTAAFANSPLRAGRPTGRRCTRLALQPRTAAAGTDPRTSWVGLVMDSPFDGLSFRQQLRDRRVDLADLVRHLDTLPGPVRARGHLELSMVDAQPGDGWIVALAVTAALVDDARATDEALAATAALPADAWTRATRDGLRDPALGTAARQCFVAAYAALARQGVAREVRDAVATFIDDYVNRARCPADDVLDAVAART